MNLKKWIAILEKNGFDNVINGGTWNNVQKVITEN